jgi:hypothetical protein
MGAAVIHEAVDLLDAGQAAGHSMMFPVMVGHCLPIHGVEHAAGVEMAWPGVGKELVSSKILCVSDGEARLKDSWMGLVA